MRLNQPDGHRRRTDFGARRATAFRRSRLQVRPSLGQRALEDRTLLSLGFSFNNGVLTVAGDPLNPNANHTFQLELDPIVHQFLITTVDGQINISLLSTLTQIVVQGGGGDDLLNIDTTNGLIPVPISYDGGAGYNALTLLQTASSTVQDAERYDLGAVPGMGIDSLFGPSGAQTVEFQNLAPVTSFVPAASLTVEPAASPLFGLSGSLLNGANTITYSQGVSPAYGMVTVDSGEPIMFANKDALSLNTGPGTDSVSLNDPAVPTGSMIGTLLAGITVNGGDPSAGDTLTINAAPASDPSAPDVLDVSPTGAGTGKVQHSGGLNPPVTYSGIGQLVLAGQPGGGNTFGVDGTVGDDQFIYAPGATSDAGTVSGTLDQNDATGAGPFPLVPIRFRGMSPAAPGPGLPAPGVFFNALGAIGGTDSLVANVGPDDVTAGAAGAGTVTLQNSANGLALGRIFGANLAAAYVNGDGSGNVSVSGNTVPITVRGAAALQVTGTGAGGLAVNLAAGTAQEQGFAAVSAPTVDVLLVDGAGQSLRVAGGPGSALTYQPSGPRSGTISAQGEPLVARFANVAGTLTIDPNGGTGIPGSLTVLGTPQDDTITATAGASPAVQVNGFTVIALVGPDTAALAIDGGAGNDLLIVDSTKGAFPVPITFDGGSGQNQTALTGGTATSDSYTPGPVAASATSTLFFAGVRETVSVVASSGLLDSVFGSLAVSGTAGPDSIAYQAGPSAADGLVAVGGFPPLIFSHKSILTLAGGGGDTITVRSATVPTGLTAVNVTGVAGDSLVVDAHGSAVDVATPGVVGVMSLPPIQYANIAGIQILSAPDQPLAPVPVTLQSVAGQPLTNVVAGAFNDGAPGAAASDFNAAIDWGDGTAPSAGQIVALASGHFQVFGSHSYLKFGAMTVTVTVTDNGGNARQFVAGVPIQVMDLGGRTATIVSQLGVVTPIALTGRLDPASDSGASNADAITNVSTPKFIGTAPPGAVVTLYGMSLADGSVLTLGGGTASAAGSWSATSVRLADGRYEVFASATDATGRPLGAITIQSAVRPLVIDTAGPRVVQVAFNRIRGEVDVILEDDLSGLDQAGVTNPANYQLAARGGRGAPIALTSLDATAPSVVNEPEPVTLHYNGARRLPRANYVFTVFAGTPATGVRDLAGNTLNGALYGFLPIGNGLPGSNFVASFAASHGRPPIPPTSVGSSPSVVTSWRTLMHAASRPAKVLPHVAAHRVRRLH